MIGWKFSRQLQPIRSETKTNRGLRVHIFPRFVSATCNYLECFTGLSPCFLIGQSNVRKTEKFVSKQGQIQPFFYSNTRYKLKTELRDGAVVGAQVEIHLYRTKIAEDKRNSNYVYMFFCLIDTFSDSVYERPA